MRLKKLSIWDIFNSLKPKSNPKEWLQVLSKEAFFFFFCASEWSHLQHQVLSKFLQDVKRFECWVNHQAAALRGGVCRAPPSIIIIVCFHSHSCSSANVCEHKSPSQPQGECRPFEKSDKLTCIMNPFSDERSSDELRVKFDRFSS